MAATGQGASVQTKKENEMTTKTTTRRTAEQAYMQHYAAALALIERIHEALANHDTSPDPDDLNWGHVGDMVEIENALREVTDRMFAEGECAPAPQV
jgi:hypothetical protein